MNPVFSSWGVRLLGLGRWWGAELRAAFSDLLNRAFPTRRQPLTVVLSGQRGAIVECYGLNNSKTVSEMNRIEADGRVSWALATESGSGSEPGRRTRIVLDLGEFAFLRRIRLPLVALSHLESAIQLQMPKLLPLREKLLRSDFEVMEVDSKSASIEVELAAIKNQDIEPVIRALENAGLQPTSIHLAASTDRRIRYNFGTSQTRLDRPPLRRMDRYLYVGIAALTTCIVLVSAVQAYRAKRALDQALVETSSAATEVLEKRETLISNLQTLSALSALERSVTAASVLAEVTSRLDHDAWLTHFELKGRQLRLIGLGPDPSVIVRELNATTVLSQIALKSSMAAGNGSGKERFEITADVKEEK